MPPKLALTRDCFSKVGLRRFNLHTIAILGAGVALENAVASAWLTEVVLLDQMITGALSHNRS